MKSIKYNNFDVRFMPLNSIRNGEDYIYLKLNYDFAIFETAVFDRELIFRRSTNQIIFDANLHMQELGNCEKFIILKSNSNFSLLWTSLSGKPEMFNMRGGKKSLFDYLFLNFTKKKYSCLYIGDSVEAPVAGWRNECSVDVIHSTAFIIDDFLKETQEQYLPF